MENDLERIENIQQLHNIKEITLNKTYKEEISMDAVSNKMNSQASQILLSGKATTTNTSSPKMGSRRIFTPQFKLQVLESYRNDHDCKGNQRATARKYNIHRRQIQKWLQCEPSLRSSVANINQNSVKHQFHNVSMVQQQTKSVIIAPQSTVNSLSYTSSLLHSAHLGLDSTSHKTINVPSVSSCASTSSTQETSDSLDANLVAVVAATTGTAAKTNTAISVSTTAAIGSPLRPSAIISANRNTNSSIPPILHHHAHHYGISTYSSMPATATVPILVHNLPNSHQTPYQYQNISYSSTLPHHQAQKQHSAAYFTPLNLPIINASNSYTAADNDHLDKLNLFPIGSKAYPKFLSEKRYSYNDHQFQVNYECADAPRSTNPTNTFETVTVNHFNGDSSYSTAYPYGPMDLSLRHCRESKSKLVTNTKPKLKMNETAVKQERNGTGHDVVDLTYRKRKVFSTPHSMDVCENSFPEKLPKVSSSNEVQNKSDIYHTNKIYADHVTTNCSSTNEDDDVEIEVGMEEKFPPTSKPIKLFKPYLLDECENSSGNCINTCTKTLWGETEKCTELKQTVKGDDARLSENTFPEIVKDNISVGVESSNFHVESRSESPRSVSSPATYIPTMSPTNFHYPKGSPASSGYESSTSTYSDTSLSPQSDMHAYGQTYSLNLQMQTIYHGNTHALQQSQRVQRWLDKDDSSSLESNSIIALLV